MLNEGEKIAEDEDGGRPEYIKFYILIVVCVKMFAAVNTNRESVRQIIRFVHAKLQRATSETRKKM